MDRAGWYNLIDPPSLIELFLRFPPKDFIVREDSLMPSFCAKFQLFTTLEPSALKRLQRLPFYTRLNRLLSLYSSFSGTTVNEYSVLPDTHTASELIDSFLNMDKHKASLYIIKDLPQNSPLLSKEDNDFADELTDEALKRGFMQVEGQALAYIPIDFDSVETFMERFSASRRKNFRRKLKTRNLMQIEYKKLGDEAFKRQELLNDLYSMYLEVFSQSEIHFDLLLPDFFKALLQSDIPGVVMLYYHEGKLVGYNICLEYQNKLIDKYIGLTYPKSRELNLYFVSWFVNIEYALERGLDTYISGWTDPEVKASLGASFTFTRHLVRIKNPIIRRILSPFKGFFEGDKKRLKG